MMDRKKKLLSIVAVLTMSAMLVSCGEKSSDLVTLPEASVAKASSVKATEKEAEKESETEAKDEAAEEYASIYLEKITELNKDKTADSFVLIDVNGDGVQELAVTNSEGPLEDEGNTHLFTVSDGKLCELLSVNSGYDGGHLYVSEESNTVLSTGGMSGTEIYDLYSLEGDKLENTKELTALFNIEDDSYTYKDDDKEITEDKYFDAFAEAVSTNNPYIGIDFDGLHEVNITVQDDYVDFEQLATLEYLGFKEAKQMLEELGAK